MPTFEKRGHNVFQITWSKVKVKLSVFAKMMVDQYILTPRLESCKIGTVDAL